MATPQESVQTLLQSMEKIYTSQHVFRQVDPQQFPGVNIKFYDQSQAQLEKLGFKKIADIEDVTINQTNPPKTRTFIRTMIGTSGTVAAGIYHIPSHASSLLTKILLFVMRVKRNHFIIDLETEFTNGVFLLTSNAKMAAAIQMDIPEWHQYFSPEDTSLETLYQSHQLRITQIMERTGAQPLSMQTWEDMEAFQHRLQSLKNSYRQSVGFLTAEDIDHISDGKFDQAATTMKQALRQTKGE